MTNYKFSIITPEHSTANFPFLMELWESIKSQTYSDWEWILYTNNSCNPGLLPASITSDPRVVVVHQPDVNSNIGYIKHHAFMAGTGDILVEADHDDVLFPTCLEKLNKEYNNPNVGFVYSDNIVYHMTGEFIPYNSAFGWTHHIVQGLP